MTKRKKLKKGIMTRLLCRLLGTALILAVFAVVVPLSVPRLIGYDIYNVVSASMAPAIPVGSLIIVKPVDAVDVQEGDVIAFYSENTVITHRVTANNALEGEITTKGDANEQEDMRKVRYGQVIGKVSMHVPHLGTLGAVLTSTVGKVYLAGVLICGIMFHMIAGRLKVIAEQ